MDDFKVVTTLWIPRIKRGMTALAILGCFLFLNGCSHMHRKDGPPNFYVDETKIPDAVPKAEPKSKYGNQASYTVFGKRYYTMQSSRNYEERGTASWYGTLFHKRHTSNGERYDMLGMTAAHKTLPLPTYVQVTNLRNGRKVIVKVNDRGPFEQNRLIDLSYVAAKKLGMLGHGTAYVDVKAINPGEYQRDRFYQPIMVAHNTPAVKPRVHARSDDSFFIANSKVYAPHVTEMRDVPTYRHHHQKTNAFFLQVGAFKNKLYAERLKQRLHSLAVSAPIQITKLAHASKHLYRVQIGPFKNTAMADHMVKRLRTHGISSKKYRMVV